jgi:hypothetical protein
MKTVNLLNEIKRVKEIMGFSLINEGLPGGFADLFTPLLKNEDELRIKLGKAAKGANVELRIVESIIDVLNDPAKFDLLGPSVKRQMFQVFSQLEEIKKPLYNLVSKELGYSSTSEFEKVIAKKMKEFAIKNPGKNVSELYDNAIKELLPGENIFFKDFLANSNFPKIQKIYQGATKYLDMDEMSLKTEFEKLKKRAKKEGYKGFDDAENAPGLTDDEKELLSEMRRRKFISDQEWLDIAKLEKGTLGQFIALHDEFIRAKRKGEYKGLTFQNYLQEQVKLKMPNWYKRNAAALSDTIIRPYLNIFQNGGTLGDWRRLGVDISILSGLIVVLWRTLKTGGEAVAEYLNNLVGLTEAEIKSRWKNFWQGSPKFKVGDTTTSVYNQLDGIQNKDFATNAPIILQIDVESGLVYTDRPISIQGKLYDAVIFKLAKNILPIGEGSKFFPDYISPSNVTDSEPQTQTTFAKDIESFKNFLTSKNVDPSKAYYDVEFDMFYDGLGGEYEFSGGSFL